MRYACDSDRKVCDVYELNHGVRPDQRHVEELTGAEILDAVGGELDYLDASPPCQSWSTAGKRRMAGDANGAVFADTIRLVGETDTLAFGIENVAGLAEGG